jgi:hypothetical protein
MPTLPDVALTVDRWILTRTSNNLTSQIIRGATGQDASDDFRANSCGACWFAAAAIAQPAANAASPARYACMAQRMRRTRRRVRRERARFAADQLSSRGGGGAPRPLGMPEATNFATAVISSGFSAAASDDISPWPLLITRAILATSA